MHSAKDLLNYTSHLKILYVEDDDKLREETVFLFEAFFQEIDTAIDGLDGLKKYNDKLYDIVLTDINMPNMNGVEMISKIKEINAEQKIIAISAHNETDILLQLVKYGVSSFILKPIIQTEAINALYPVSRDAYTQILNIKLVEELNEKTEKLEEQIRLLKTKTDTIDIKHNQIEKLLQIKKSKEEPLLSDYFKEEISEDNENVIFLKDHADDLLEDFQEITEKLYNTVRSPSRDDVLSVSVILAKISSMLLHYTPYLDNLANTINELSLAINENLPEFEAILESDGNSVLILFEAVSSDMERYVERFSVESMAMKNSHHIHEPTELSIKQIISLFVANQFEDSEIEFF